MMKKIGIVALICCVIAFINYHAFAQAVSTFDVYTDKRSAENHYIPSGWMGDTDDIKMNDQYMQNPYSGSTCIQFVYTAEGSKGRGWAGVYWQNPANNWGTKKGGYDLTGMTKLTFWARGEKGGEKIEKFVAGGIRDVYSDTVEVSLGPIELTDTWKQYTINLVNKDLSYVSGGFAWATSAVFNPNGATFYLDEIKFERDPTMKPEIKGQENLPFYVYVDSGSINNHFIPSGWMGDYGDIKFNGASTQDPYLGNTCIEIVYTHQFSQGQKWAGIYWQNPANNWGTQDAGFDLSKATKLTFWAKGKNGGERIEEFKVGGIMGEYSDSDEATIGPVILAEEWKQYTIDLAGKDMSYIIAGFCWSLDGMVVPGPVTFYLDEIRYE